MPLPVVIEEIFQLIGHAPALEMVRAFGGQELRIPARMEGETWKNLVNVLGEADARRLAEVFRGETIYIALCMKAIKAERNLRMIARFDELLVNGMSGGRAVSMLVREFGPISYRQVETIVNTPLPSPGDGCLQATLF